MEDSILVVDHEKLVSFSLKVFSRIFEFLNLDVDGQFLNEFKASLANKHAITDYPGLERNPESTINTWSNRLTVREVRAASDYFQRVALISE